jgi:hypothetical protein
MWAPDRFPHGECMIATAVSPMAMPAASRRERSPVMTRGNATPNAHADTMNVPRAAASIRYSGQCARSVSIAFTPVEDAGGPEYSAEYFERIGGCFGSMDRLTVLIEMNVRWLRQALDLLYRIDDAQYASTPAGMAPHRAGGHLRHIVEFYQAFLSGLESSHIDYDARPRDLAVERFRESAESAIYSILNALETSHDVRTDRIIWVRMEDASAAVAKPFMESSVSRELQVLSSHTIHHFALISMTLRLHGVEMEADFGMAPSTIRYLSGMAEAA